MALNPDKEYAVLMFPGSKHRVLVAGEGQIYTEGDLDTETKVFTPTHMIPGFIPESHIPEGSTVVDVLSPDVQKVRPDLYVSLPLPGDRENKIVNTEFMGKKSKEDYISCRGMARITRATSVEIGGRQVPVAASNRSLSEYQEGTLYVNKAGTLGFRPDSDPGVIYIRAESRTLRTFVNRLGQQVTANRPNESLYDALVEENDPDAQRLSTWLDPLE